MSGLLHLSVSLQFLTQIIHIEFTEMHDLKKKKEKNPNNNPI